MFRRLDPKYRSAPTAGIALCASALLTVTAGCASPDPSAAEHNPLDDSPPNILMVLMDDLGYSDIGVYGSEISTPNIDSVAGEGFLFTDFHANPLCAPTRAALMTGQDPHRVGLGSMEGLVAPGVPLTTPGYKGSLEGDYTSIAQILSDADYATYQVGKWHLGTAQNQTPRALGFDQNYTMYMGGASHYSDALRLRPAEQPPTDKVTYERNGEAISELPSDFYSTNAYTEEMLSMIDSGLDGDRPFFGYLAYTAPHDPLHVPDSALVEKYLDLYSGQGPEKLRDDRISAMADLGLIDPDVRTRWPVQASDADSLSAEQRRDLAYRQAVYAAMIERADTQLGRIIDRLKETGEYENTLIAIASDNGASGLSTATYTRTPGAREWLDEHYPLVGDIDGYGEPGSFPALSLYNAQASSGPYFHSKSALYEGGTRVPLIVKPPRQTGNPGSPRQVDTFAHISDLYPTFAEYAGAALVDSDVLSGDSAKGVLDGTTDAIGDDRFGWSMFGERAFRDGKMKLIFATPGNSGTGRYELYDLADDPGETYDLAPSRPDEVTRIAALWDQYAAENNVVPVDFAAVDTSGRAMASFFYEMDWAD